MAWTHHASNSFGEMHLVFEQSRVLLLGKPKIGKSHWLGAFASAATTGTEFMNQQFSRPLKVMWLQAEIIHEFLNKESICTINPSYMTENFLNWVNQT